MLTSQGTEPLSATHKSRRVCVLLNPSSGRFAGCRGALSRDIERQFGRHGISAVLNFAEGDNLRLVASRAMRDALDEKVDAIAVGGGDGTLSTVAGVLADSDIPLGIIPLGTLNHFAKDLGIPLSIEGAVAAIAEGTSRAIDAGEASGRIFINNSSIGIYPYIVLDRERRRNAGVPKYFAMIPAIVRTVRNLPFRKLTITTTGKTSEHRSPCVLVGNNRYNLRGIALGERERLDQGQLSLHIAKSQNRFALMLLMGRSLLGILNTDDDLQCIHAEAFEINSRRKKLLVAFDGEVEIARTPLRYRIRPGALRVLVPASALRT